ncbi:uncharacterized protein LOC127881043 isoform X3 [Dreissena polymorpha]|nr:uncharacterized protein LOC127881043 isoform X3 [Dreissena polymorpha]
MILSVLFVLGLIRVGAAVENVAVPCIANNNTCSDNKKVCEKGFCHIALGEKCTILTEQPSPSQNGDMVTTAQNGGSSEKPQSTTAGSGGQHMTTAGGGDKLSSSSITTATTTTTEPSSTSVASSTSSGNGASSSVGSRKKRSEDEKRECVTNAVCKQAGENKICACAGGFSKDANGLCAGDADSGAVTLFGPAITMLTTVMALMHSI